ncbi:MAG: hypothetical protein RLZZ211_794 [Bacteroidota bacterium]|jgi:hypothetical protein
MKNPLLISLFIGIAVGTVNHFYLRSKGHRSPAQWFMQVVVFFALAFSVFKFLR